MTYSINTAIPVSGTYPQQIPDQEETNVSSINKVAFFTFASLATFFAVSTSIPLMPIAIPITASLITGAILTVALTAPRRIHPHIQTNYSVAMPPIPSVNYYRPFYVPFYAPSYPYRHCYTPPRRDFVGERGPRVIHCEPSHRRYRTFNVATRPIHTSSHHKMTFTCPNVRRDIVGERLSF